MIEQRIARFLAVLTLYVSTGYAASPNYIIYIDAGSSGSRLHLFQYDYPASSSSLPWIKDVFSSKTSPGLSSFSDKPEGAGLSLKKVLDDASSKLSEYHIDSSTVPVNVFGTAGMRLLSSAAQQAIYSDVTEYIKTNYQFKNIQAVTISGKMEGIYGWLDINYLAGSFNLPSDKTYGSIDMGGASTEIVYETSDQSYPDDTVSLNVAGNRYKIYSKSVLDAGMDKTRESMSLDDAASSCYPLNYPIREGVYGKFNFSTCNELYSALIKKLFSSIPAIDPRQVFVAYSGIYYTYHFMEVDSSPDKATVMTRVKEVCNQSWEEFKSNYPTTPEMYLNGYCANSVYNMNLLYNFYQIKDGQLQVRNNINNQDIDWPLGALIYHLEN